MTAPKGESPSPRQETNTAVPREAQEAAETADKVLELNRLRQDIEQYKETPKATLSFKRSVYEIPEAKKPNVDKAKAYLALLVRNPEMENIHVYLKGTADRTTFNLDASGRNVDLNRGTQWRADYLRALKSITGTGSVPALSSLDLNKDDIDAVHKLPLNSQQEVMNHAIAYLRAERLQRELESVCGGTKVDFRIDTAWAKDTKTRSGTLVEISTEGGPRTKMVGPVEQLLEAGPVRRKTMRPIEFPAKKPAKQPLRPEQQPDSVEQLLEAGSVRPQTMRPIEFPAKKPAATVKDEGETEEEAAASAAARMIREDLTRIPTNKMPLPALESSPTLTDSTTLPSDDLLLPPERE